MAAGGRRRKPCRRFVAASWSEVPTLTQMADEAPNEDHHRADRALLSKSRAVIECHGVWRRERGVWSQQLAFSRGSRNRCGLMYDLRSARRECFDGFIRCW